MTDTIAKKKKERFTVQLPVELIEQARNAAFWTPGLTLASLVEEGLTRVLEELEAERNEPFPKRSGKLRAGRPIG